MINAIKNYMLLPTTVTQFEQDYLQRMNRVAVGFFVAHLPVFVAIAYFNETGPLTATVLTSAILSGPLLAYRYWVSQRAISTIMGVTAMFMGGLLVHFGQGPVQIEMHFYFFVLIALLAVFANPMVVFAGAVTAALHHALLWLLLPASVFNYDAPFWVVAVHATFVVLESVAASFIARSFFDNVISLEKKVAARTAEVEIRNRDMRVILDSVQQGFFTIDIGGCISHERSRAVERLLGEIEGQTTLVEAIGRHDPKAAMWLEIGLDEVFAEIMPYEVTVDQLPSRFAVNEKTISIRYRPVRTGAELTALTIVLTDITSDVEREKLEATSKEMIGMIQRISSDRRGFLEFVQEAESLISDLRQESRDDLVMLLRRVHTLKGNASIFGLQSVADTCHVIEDYLNEHNESPPPEAWDAMFDSWETARNNLRQLVTDEAGGIHLSDESYNELLVAVLAGVDKEELINRVVDWRLEPTGNRLMRVAEQATGLAERLGKGAISVDVDGHDLRTEPEAWCGFWTSLVHVIRNAVDHGLETPDERIAAGKSEFGSLALTTTTSDEEFHVSVVDDGHGVRWGRIEQLAEQRGLACQTHEDLVEALFSDGLSTAEHVTQTSGRGVGMAAVKEACERMNGRISVQSTGGQGTTFKFSFPIETMAPETNDLLASHGVAQPRSATSPYAVVN